PASRGDARRSREHTAASACRSSGTAPASPAGGGGSWRRKRRPRPPHPAAAPRSRAPQTARGPGADPRPTIAAPTARPPNAAAVPDSGPTVASRTCMIVGRILQRCAEEMRDRLGGLTPREYLRTRGSLVVTKEYERPHEMSWDDASYQGDAYGTYGWGCDIVEVEVDRDTWEARPLSFTTVHEIGKAIHPMLAAGQIEGGSAQGLGYALLEDVVMRDGRMANAQLTNYIIPTTLDTPALCVTMLENAYEHAPFGAHGVTAM